MLDYQHSAFTTWEMSFERLVQISPTSVPFLQLLGFVNNQDISHLLYDPEHPNRKIEWDDQSNNAHSYSEALTFITKLCLIRRNGKLHTYDIHPITHFWIRERLPGSQQAYFSRAAFKFVAQALPEVSLEDSDSTTAWKIHRRLYAHVKQLGITSRHMLRPSRIARTNHSWQHLT